MPNLPHLPQNASDEETQKHLRPKRRSLPAFLSPEDEVEVDALFRKQGIIAKCAQEQVSHDDIARLQPFQWLNDEVINFYGRMILLRANESKIIPSTGKQPLNAHYFTSFFWSKLKAEGYEKARLSKWTKKVCFLNHVQGRKD